MAKGDDLDPALHRAGQARHELQRVAPFQPDDRPRRAIMSPLRDHPHIKHLSPEMTMIYAKTLASTHEAEFLRYRKLTADARELDTDPRDLYDMLQLDKRTDRTLPNARPLP